MPTLGKLFTDTKTGRRIISRSYKLCVKFEQYWFGTSDTWTLNHIYNTESFNIQVFVDNVMIVPEEVVVDALDTITLHFSEPLSGFCNVLFYTNENCDCDRVLNPTPTPTPTLTPTPTVTPPASPPPPPIPFMLEVTKNTINVLSFPTVDDFGATLVYDATIDWGDGTAIETLNTAGTYSHTYAAEVPLHPIVTIAGDCPGYIAHPDHITDRFANRIDVIQWGDQKWKMLKDAFKDTYAFIIATDVPDLSECTSVSQMLRNTEQGAWDLNEPYGIRRWDFTSPHITDLDYFIADSTNFGGDISGWILGNVTSTVGTFQNCDMWFTWEAGAEYMFTDVSKVTDMSYMFQGNYSFGDDAINNWDVSNVINMTHMFDGCSRYFHMGTRDLSTWNTSNVTDMSYMFFAVWYWGGQGLENFNTTKVTNMERMFENAWYIGFDGEINMAGWNVSNVTNMDNMFKHAGWTQVHTGISGWDVSKVATFNSMFEQSWEFNADLSGWTLTAATSLSRMFYECYNWVLPVFTITPLVTNTSEMFTSCALFNENISGWPMLNVTDISGMFDDCKAFNQPIGVWNTGNVLNMDRLFYNADVFNQPLSAWDTSKVTSMIATFRLTDTFDQDVSGWNVEACAAFTDMFYQAIAFSTANYDLLLNAWSLQTLTPSMTIRFDASYTIATSQAARDILTSAPNLWTITDAGGI